MIHSGKPQFFNFSHELKKNNERMKTPGIKIVSPDKTPLIY